MSNRTRLASLLSILALEGILITDPVRPWLPFSLWTLNQDAFSTAGLMAFVALAFMGGLIPLTFPGLRPLPVTFPFIGACLILYGLPPAAALATLTVITASLRDTPGVAAPFEGPRVPWPAALAGLGLGLIVADTSGYFLPFNPTNRDTFLPQEILATVGLLSAGGALAAVVARFLGQSIQREESLQVRWGRILVSAPIAAAIAVAAAQAVRIWGLGPVGLALL
ncbi:MAG TPA: hypothetical protein VNI57_08395, partial [Candidatus Saccharimonadales bacterium]|nr:hypothetical protein [Candidatus Saccharimonadales bacterium]